MMCFYYVISIFYGSVRAIGFEESNIEYLQY